jgi:hypothetical protein
MQVAMFDRGQIDVQTLEVLRSTASILDDYELTSPIAQACFEKAETAVRTSKLLIARSDTLIEQLSRDLVQSGDSGAAGPDECPAGKAEDDEAHRAEKAL